MILWARLAAWCVIAGAVSCAAQTGAAQPHHQEWVVFDSIADNLHIPWDVAFGPDGAVFYTERTGSVGVIQNGTRSTIHTIPVGGGEGGMLGVAVHPDFGENGLVYTYHTGEGPRGYGNAVSTYRYDSHTLEYVATILDGIPAGSIHNGGRIQFGPDGKIYVATGDAGNAALSQDLGSLAGKILRLNPDGTIPDDNPFAESPVYAYGFRNPQGMAWVRSGDMVATDHGPSGLYGRGHDEINVVVPGGNYGWPDAIGGDIIPGTIPPLVHSGDDTWAPSGMAAVRDWTIPGWDDIILVAALRGQHIGVVSVADATYQKVFPGEFGRVRHVAQHPDGSIYLLTSNTDGRGAPGDGDDRIIRMEPVYSIPREVEDIVRMLWGWYADGLINGGQLRGALEYYGAGR